MRNNFHREIWNWINYLTFSPFFFFWRMQLRPTVDQPRRMKLGKRTGFDDVGHCLGLATGAQISVCKAPSLSTGPAVPLTGTKMVQERPLLLWEGETRLPDCGVVHQVAILCASLSPYSVKKLTTRADYQWGILNLTEPNLKITSNKFL